MLTHLRPQYWLMSVHLLQHGCKWNSVLMGFYGLSEPESLMGTKCVNLNDLSCHQCTAWQTEMSWNIITGLLTDWNLVMNLKLPSKCKKSHNLRGIYEHSASFIQMVFLLNPVLWLTMLDISLSIFYTKGIYCWCVY